MNKDKEDIYIYGAGKTGRRLLLLIKKNYFDDVRPIGFIDREKTGTINEIPIMKADVTQKEITVVIAISDEETAKNIDSYLRNLGHLNIFWHKYKEFQTFGDFFKEQCVIDKIWTMPCLKHVEMHVMDGCNLNCRGCAHFSPLFDKTIPDFNRRINDVIEISKKDVFIENFYLLGGEPFLNSELNKYIDYSAKHLPDSRIIIVTNGILIPNLSDDLCLTIKRNKVIVEITDYPPTQNLHYKIYDTLKKFDISFYYKQLNFNNRFSKPFSEKKGKSIYDNYCISFGCVNLFEGKIARCPQLMYLHKFNEAFNKSLPEDGIHNLTKTKGGEELVKLMYKKVPLCDYCVYNEMKWGVCGKYPEAEDFITKD